jgi:predicted ATPase
LAAAFDNEVCFVDLVGIDDPAGVPRAVAAALGCEVAPQESLARVLAHLQDKETLLVFDNCDQVFAGVVRLTERLLTETPLIHVVISSREPLHLARTFAAEK